MEETTTQSTEVEVIETHKIPDWIQCEQCEGDISQCDYAKCKKEFKEKQDLIHCTGAEEDFHFCNKECATNFFEPALESSKAIKVG